MITIEIRMYYIVYVYEDADTTDFAAADTHNEMSSICPRATDSQ